MFSLLIFSKTDKMTTAIHERMVNVKNWKIYMYLIITYITMHVGSVFLTIPLIQYFNGDISLSEQEVAYSATAWSLFSTNLVAAIIFIALILSNKKFSHVFKGKPSSIGNTILWGFIGFFLAMFGQLLAAFIETKLGVEAGSANTELLSDIARISPIIIISMVIFAPLLEEIIFRRVLFGGLYRKTNFIIAALISAVVFAAVHGELHHLLIYMAPALVFSYIYYRTKRLLAPMLAHLLMNGFVVIVQLNYEKLEEFQKMNQAFFFLFH